MIVVVMKPYIYEGLISETLKDSYQKRDLESCLTWLKECVQGSGEIVMSIVDSNKCVPTPPPHPHKTPRTQDT